MNTTTNTRGVRYTQEQVEACIVAYRNGDLNYCRAGIIDLLTAYAATIRQNPERGVTEAMVEAPLAGRWHHGNGALCCGSFRIARADWEAGVCAADGLRDQVFDWIVSQLNSQSAALSAEPAAQGEVLIEAVGRVERDMTGELCINWLVEGGIHALIEGSVLLCSEHDHLTDDDGSVTLYTAPPAQPAEVEATLRRILERGKHRTDGDLAALLDRVEHMTRGDQDLIAMQRTEIRLMGEKAAQPAERVPDGWVLVPREPTFSMQAAHQIHGDTSDWWNAVVEAAKSAASPAAPADGDGKGVNRG